MKCFKCGYEMIESTTTDVTDLGNCLIIVRNVPCFKCSECDEVFFTGATMKTLEKIINTAKMIANEITIIDYSKTAA